MAFAGWIYDGLPVGYWIDQLKSACQPVKVPADQEGLVATPKKPAAPKPQAAPSTNGSGSHGLEAGVV
jgi:hypothetical protein